MTVKELLAQLQKLLESNPGEVTEDSKIVVTLGVLKGMVQSALNDDADYFPQPVITFADDAAYVTIDLDSEDSPGSILICGGPELETPPVL